MCSCVAQTLVRREAEDGQDGSSVIVSYASFVFSRHCVALLYFGIMFMTDVAQLENLNVALDRDMKKPAIAANDAGA